MVFLWFLFVGVSGELDLKDVLIEFNRLGVGIGPWQKVSPDEFSKEGCQRGRQGFPALEFAFDPGRQHSLDPGLDGGGVFSNQLTASRIRPGVVQLSPEPEISEGRTRAEEIGSIR